MEYIDNPDEEGDFNQFEDDEEYVEPEETKEEEILEQNQNPDLPEYCMQGLEPLDYEIQVCDPTIKDGLTKYYIYSVKVIILILILIIPKGNR